MKASLIVVLLMVGMMSQVMHAEEEAKLNVLSEPASVRLGWPADAKVLMIHADDIGMCHAANEAAKIAFPDGRITSCSVMMPCPWAYDFCQWAREHQDTYDIGLHITLTSEWKTYKWRPVLGPYKVPSLCDKNGFFYPDVLQVALRAKPEEVEAEIRAQVQRAIDWGLRPTHLDTHMGTVFARPDFVKAFMKVAREFGITPFLIEPTMNLVEMAKKRGMPMTGEMLKLFKDYKSAKLDYFTYPEKPQGDRSYEARKANLVKQLRELKPGITCMIIHPSIMSPELKDITGSAETRAWELAIFDDPDIRKLIKDEGIHLVTWRELAKRCPMPEPTKTTAKAKPE